MKNRFFVALRMTERLDSCLHRNDKGGAGRTHEIAAACYAGLAMTKGAVKNLRIFRCGKDDTRLYNT